MIIMVNTLRQANTIIAVQYEIQGAEIKDRTQMELTKTTSMVCACYHA